MAVSPSALGDVMEVFERNFRERGEVGASVSVWSDGEEVLSEGQGWKDRKRTAEWTKETMVPVFSATKVPSAATLLVALESRGLSEETLVRDVWQRFPVAEATFAHLLSHQCGLAVLDERVSIFHHAHVVSAIEKQVPAWSLGEGHGYHPRTFGALMDEPVRKLTGLQLGDYWRKAIADPLGLDFWIGLPESQWQRMADLYPGRVGKAELADGFYKQLTQSGSFTRRAFSSPRGLHGVHEMNEPQAWTAALPAMGGIGTASALAKFYQAVIGGIESPLSAKVRRALAEPQSSAEDRVLLRPTVFTCGAQRDPLGADGGKLRTLYGPSISAFGHPGAGGSHAMGDPETGVSFAYVMNQMDLNVMPGVKCCDMVNALFAELGG
ncbi:MAG: serine hydrolase domain-containing protein [Verrucomicrobiales bacterium]|nr:serine hydrolase domain-containing protein [Verrucomicrobiota bacterium JB025]